MLPLFDGYFNFLGEGLIVGIAPEGYLGCVFALFGQFLDFESGLAFGAGGCLICFSFDFDMDFHVFNCFSPAVFQSDKVFFGFS